MPLFGQDAQLGQVYDAVPEQELNKFDGMIDALLKSGMSNDAIEDEIRNIEAHGELNDMREGSTTGALGQVDMDTLSKLMDAFNPPRKQLSPERIHNLGVMYGEPISQGRLDYFEDQLNREPNQSYMGEFPQFPK